MRIPVVLTVIACLSGLSTPSGAAQIFASPAIYASPAQRSAQCSFGNLGTKTIAADVHIVDEAGNAFSVNTTCNEPIQPNFICQVFAFNIPNGQAVACTATVAGSASKLRGSLTLFDANEVPLRAAELR